MTDQPGVAQSGESVVDSRGWVTRMVDFAEKGAALVYHDVLAVQADATRWVAANPAVADLVQKGVNYVLALLAADGLPTREVWLVATTVEASLKELAANDPTVSSVQPEAAGPAKA